MPVEPTNAQLRRHSKKDTDEFPFKISGHAREIEQKRARGEISCAECRRLKIKCSKEIPCSSCVRRGCRSICPQGSLATGEGTRYVLAATEHLHRRISRLSSRIRELEDALASIHREHSDEPHPLLRDDHLSPEQDDDTKQGQGSAPNEGSKPSSEVIEAFGTLRISEHGVSRFFGSTAGSEVLLMAVIDQGEDDTPSNSPSPPSAIADQQAASTVAFFSRSFPFTPLGSVPEVQGLIESYLPPWDRTNHLCRIYFAEVSWLIRSVLPGQVYDYMLPSIYRKTEPNTGEEYNTPHHVSLLFVILALGALVESTTEDRDGYPDVQEAEHYHQIAKAALPLQPILEKPSIYAIQTLHLMSIYYAMSGEDLASQNSMEMTWNIVTLASHLAQTIGLHRDSARWGLDENMIERRRTIFWNLYTADVWNSLSTGRPPSFTLAYVDCKLPGYAHTAGKELNMLPYYNWQFNFATDVVSRVAAQACAAQTPSYETIMELDKKVREYPLPNLQDGQGGMVNKFERCICDHIRETLLLHIHRSFFAQAILDEPTNPLKSTYAPSFLATYRASTQILRAVRDQYSLYPNACARWWIMWSHAFSAAVVFGMVVTKGPRSPLANAAMKELDEACILFSKVATASKRANKALPILARLSTNARAALAAAKDDPNSGAMWTLNNEYDDLSIFAGHTRLVSSQQPLPETATNRAGYSAAPISLSLPISSYPPQSQTISQPSPISATSSTSPYSLFPPHQETVFKSSPEPPPMHRQTDQLKIPNVQSFSSWNVSSPITGPSLHRDVPPSVPSSSMTPARENMRQYSPHDMQTYTWPQPVPSMHRGPRQERRRSPDKSHSHSSPMDYQFEYPARPNPRPPQQQPTIFPGPFPPISGFNAGDRPPASPMDLASMGIASSNSRLDERFLTFMNDSGLLGDDPRRTRHPSYR